MSTGNGRKVFIVLNPKSGSVAQADALRETLKTSFSSPQWEPEIYELSGEKEDIAAICRKACDEGASMVVACGGDGTVVSVANGLVNCTVPLGILPMGTGNDLARVLSVPLKLEDALALLVSESDHEIVDVDALKVGDRYFFSNVSVGFSPGMMKDTKPEHKKRFGLLAYIWTMFKQSRIFKLHRYTLTVDGRPQYIRASEVLISNPTMLETPLQPFGPPETLNDGKLEAYMVTASTWRDYARLLWDLIRRPGRSSAKLKHQVGQKTIRIEADRQPQLVQADGEIIGHTPVDVEMVPKAIHVIMPKPKPVEATA